jgi:CTP:molybdopterin cytidylyltransferase MocA
VTAGLILAAGESRRMGYPKALLRYREETFMDRLVGLLTAHCSPVIVVLGARAEEIRAGARRPATFVVNRDWRLGQTSSLRCGLGAVPPAAEGVLFTLVDHPAVESSTIERLLDIGLPPDARGSAGASGNSPEPLLRIPRYQSHRGHPIWFSRVLIPELAAVHEPGTAKDVIHAHHAETLFLDLDDPGVVADIDDPAAYRSLTGAAV